VKTENDCDRYI
jgi:hypothetical protein